MKPLPRITEPDEGKVHYGADALSGNVTLCGLTDFLYAKEKGRGTRLPVNCDACLSIVAFVRSHSD